MTSQTSLAWRTWSQRRMRPSAGRPWCSRSRSPATFRPRCSIVGREGRVPYTALSLELASRFAEQAALALGLAAADRDRRRLAVFEDRDRIARDLHDLVIQRLFATGLGLQGFAGQHPDPAARSRLEGYVEDLDSTIRDIRSAIYSLQAAERSGGTARAAIEQLLDDARGQLGSRPRLSISGPLDSALGGEVAADLIAVVREALSNVVRHAQARAVEVEITVGDGMVVLRVDDDGQGIADRDTRRSGLANLAERASRHAGQLQLDASPSGGTRLTWNGTTGQRRRIGLIVEVWTAGTGPSTLSRFAVHSDPCLERLQVDARDLGAFFCVARAEVRSRARHAAQSGSRAQGTTRLGMSWCATPTITHWRQVRRGVAEMSELKVRPAPSGAMSAARRSGTTSSDHSAQARATDQPCRDPPLFPPSEPQPTQTPATDHPRGNLRVDHHALVRADRMPSSRSARRSRGRPAEAPGRPVHCRHHRGRRRRCRRRRRS